MSVVSVPPALPSRRDDLSPIFTLILLFGAVGVVILLLGVAEFFFFEPPGQHTNLRAHVVGVFAYSPKSRNIHGRPATHFTQYQPMAAEVDWATVPASTEVDAKWFDGLGDEVGGVGPASAGALRRRQKDIIPVETLSGLDKNLPGQYLFVVERVSRGRPVEVIGRATVLVTRG